MHAFFRASTYYRSAMFSAPFGDPRQDAYLTATRECCREGGKLSTPRIEVLEIPFGNACLPGYFVSAGKSKGPTLLVLNGGDSANEEMVQWLGFACAERGWNCAVFEGPGQWSARQMNPGLTMRPDFEVPTKAVIDFIFQREDVDQARLALYGPSLGSLLVTRVAAHEKRVRACCADGLVVDVYEAWHAVLPKVIQMAPDAVFDAMFSAFEKLSPQARDTANHLRAIIGDVKTPHELLDAWRAFSVSDLAPKIECPMLILYGEAEVAQTNATVTFSALKFIQQLQCPASVRMFDYDDGWAATHCHIGGLAALHGVLFDWLDKAVHHPERLPRYDVEEKVFDVLARYVRSQEARRELDQLRHPV
jgi:pimeloyl-ACP methyl ester carboxylesterase